MEENKLFSFGSSIDEGWTSARELEIINDGDNHYIIKTNLGSVRVKKGMLESGNCKKELKTIGLLIQPHSFTERTYPETYVRYDTSDIVIHKMTNYYFGFGGLNK